MRNIWTTLFLSSIVNSIFRYYPKRITNAIISANSPAASTKANPKIVIPKSFCCNDGFRDTPWIYAANTNPTPTPTPANPTEATPAPIIFADCNIWLFILIFLFYI